MNMITALMTMVFHGAVGLSDGIVALLNSAKKVVFFTVIAFVVGIVFNALGHESWNYVLFFVIWAYYVYYFGVYLFAPAPLVAVGGLMTALSSVNSQASFNDYATFLARVLARWMHFISLAILLSCVVPYSKHPWLILPLLATLVVLGMSIAVFNTVTPWYKRLSFFVSIGVLVFALAPPIWSVIEAPASAVMIKVFGGSPFSVLVPSGAEKQLGVAKEKLREFRDRELQERITAIMGNAKLTREEKEKQIDAVAREMSFSGKTGDVLQVISEKTGEAIIGIRDWWSTPSPKPQASAVQPPPKPQPEKTIILRKGDVYTFTLGPGEMSPWIDVVPGVRYDVVNQYHKPEELHFENGLITLPGDKMPHMYHAVFKVKNVGGVDYHFIVKGG